MSQSEWHSRWKIRISKRHCGGDAQRRRGTAAKRHRAVARHSGGGEGQLGRTHGGREANSERKAGRGGSAGEAESGRCRAGAWQSGENENGESEYGERQSGLDPERWEAKC